jgi:endoglucanase
MLSSSELLAQLSNAAGTPGNEGEVRTIITQQLGGIADFSHDRLGSLICFKQGQAATPKVMIAAHMDEIGFIVRYVTNDGFVKFHPLGGWWSHVLMAQQVIIKTEKGDVPGIIGAKPPHHLSAEERKKLLKLKDMFIDVGARDKSQAEQEFGIMPGDHIVPATQFAPLGTPRLVSGKAFDDRVGVALMIDALQHFADKQHPNALYGVGTTQEEVGTRGADTAVDMVNPDVAIVLEGTPADDMPGVHKDEAQGIVGNGPQIRLFDPTMITNRAFARWMLNVAETSTIRHQVAVRVGGGTDARPIHVHLGGVPTIVLGVPVRYAHSHAGILSLEDYEQTLRLLVEALQRLDAAIVNSFTDF